MAISVGLYQATAVLKQFNMDQNYLFKDVCPNVYGKYGKLVFFSAIFSSGSETG